MRKSLQEYLEVLEGQDKARGTLQQYSGGLKAFSDWLDKEGAEPDEIGTRGIQRYLSWLKTERGYAPKTIRGYFSPVSGYYGHLKSAGEIENDPTEDVRVADYASEETLKERKTKERRVYFTKDELRAVVENVPAPTIRNRLMVLFQYYTALRRQEVVDVKLSDLDRENRQVKVRGKGGKINRAHWQPRLDSLLRAWIDGGYRSESPYARESDYLFVSESAEQVSADTLNDVVVEASENAGTQEVYTRDAIGRRRYKYTSHALRHSFAMHFLENGGDIKVLSKLLAHSSVTTTEIYADVLQERAAEEYQEYAPDLELDL